MLLTILIPIKNEEWTLEETVKNIFDKLEGESFDFEIFMIYDESPDNTLKVAEKLKKKYRKIKILKRKPPAGFGLALRDGFKYAKGDLILIVMGDGSDEIECIPKFLEKIEEGYDAVFASRFMKGGKVYDYPRLKLFCNRLANNTIRLLHRMPFNDITNSYKIYRKSIFSKINLESDGFEILAELPIKTFKNKFKCTQIPSKWYNRKRGKSKMNLTKSGFNYAITVFRLLRYKPYNGG